MGRGAIIAFVGWLRPALTSQGHPLAPNRQDPSIDHRGRSRGKAARVPRPQLSRVGNESRPAIRHCQCARVPARPGKSVGRMGELCRGWGRQSRASRAVKTECRKRGNVADVDAEITLPGSEVPKGGERVGRVLWRRRRVVFGLCAYCESSRTSALLHSPSFMSSRQVSPAMLALLTGPSTCRARRC